MAYANKESEEALKITWADLNKMPSDQKTVICDLSEYLCEYYKKYSNKTKATQIHIALDNRDTEKNTLVKRIAEKAQKAKEYGLDKYLIVVDAIKNFGSATNLATG